mmetsp:Transcript_482/g.1817  ORF Transcript_482/g.1817 Transcript_482/m.1817 type:complete len:239 (+) Transcript_482:862-1578(+)
MALTRLRARLACGAVPAAAAGRAGLVTAVRVHERLGHAHEHQAQHDAHGGSCDAPGARVLRALLLRPRCRPWGRQRGVRLLRACSLKDEPHGRSDHHAARHRIAGRRERGREAGGEEEGHHAQAGAGSGDPAEPQHKLGSVPLHAGTRLRRNVRNGAVVRSAHERPGCWELRSRGSDASRGNCSDHQRAQHCHAPGQAGGARAQVGAAKGRLAMGVRLGVRSGACNCHGGGGTAALPG